MAGLAAIQDEAATEVEKAGSAIQGLSAEVSETHGSYCNASVQSLAEAEKALDDLTVALNHCSERLAERLRAAGEKYRSADQLY